MKYLIFFMILCSSLSCGRSSFNPEWTAKRAPSQFYARFETTKGNFEIEVNREWSPMAVDRLYQLLEHNFYDNVLIYRVVPNFVVQFGNTDTTITQNWNSYKVLDEPVIAGNEMGNVSFARAGKQTRGNDLFINLRNNQYLDTIQYEGVTGFPAIGRVVKGMEVAEAVYSGYGDKTMEVYDSLSSDRKEFERLFPMLDVIKRAYIIKEVN